MRFDDRWCFANAHKAFFHSKSAESARWWKAETINGLKYIFSVKQLEFPWAFIYLCLFSEFSFRLKSNSSIAQQGSDWRALYLSFRLEIVKRYFFMSHIIYFCDTRGEKKKSSWNVNRISFSILIYVNGTFFIFFYFISCLFRFPRLAFIANRFLRKSMIQFSAIFSLSFAYE